MGSRKFELVITVETKKSLTKLTIKIGKVVNWREGERIVTGHGDCFEHNFLSKRNMPAFHQQGRELD